LHMLLCRLDDLVVIFNLLLNCEIALELSLFVLICNDFIQS